MKLADLAESLAPEPPPCFSTVQWIGWVRSSAETVNTAVSERVLIGKPLVFNRTVSFCSDCTVEHRSRMLKADRCDPQALLKVGVPA